MSLCEKYDKSKATRIYFSSWNTLSQARLYSGKQSKIKIALFQTSAQRGTEDALARRYKKGVGVCFFVVEKFNSSLRAPICFMVGALTQHIWHAKSQSAATFCYGAMRLFTATTPSLILCPHVKFGKYYYC